MAVDVALHAPAADGDARNWHAHLLMTTRRVSEAGLAAKAELELSDGERRKRGLCSGTEAVLELRELWAVVVNKALEESGEEVRVDHRTLEAQGIARAPQPKIGAITLAMEKKGKQTRRREQLRNHVEEEQRRTELRTLIAEEEIELCRIRVNPVERWRRAVAALADIEGAHMRIEQDRRLALGEELPAVPEVTVIAARLAREARIEAARAMASESGWRRWWSRLWTEQTRAAVNRAQMLERIARGQQRPTLEHARVRQGYVDRRLDAERRKAQRTNILEEALSDLANRRLAALADLEQARKAQPPRDGGTIQRRAGADRGPEFESRGTVWGSPTL